MAGVHTFTRRQSSSIGPLPVSASPISGTIARNGLPRTRAVFDGIDDAGPGLWSDWRLESIDAGSRGAVADSFEGHDALQRATANPARGGLDHRPGAGL
jgi:hypothetical protein